MKRRNVIVEIVKTEQGTMAIWGFISRLVIGQEWKWKCVQENWMGGLWEMFRNWNTYSSMLLRSMNKRTQTLLLLQ